MILLLLLTIVAVRYGDLILTKSLVISAADEAAYPTTWHGDQSAGGNSAVTGSSARPLRWSCDLRMRYRYPFCGYAIVLDKLPNHGVDLSRYQTVLIDLEYRGAADSVRLYLKNFDARYGNPAARETAKINQIDLPIRPGRQILRAPLSGFVVPEWWIQQNRIPFRFGRSQFDNVVAIEVETGNGAPAGRHDFRMRSITLQGSVVPIERWYLGIIGCWIILICLFLISRIIDLQHDLRDRRALQYHAQGEALRAQETARLDHLTGLLNRLGITDSYQRMIVAQGSRAVAIFLIDIDHFKSINDRWGHMQGDEVLVAFAALLRQNVREDDLIGRWGGEEFLVVARVGDAQTAMEIANKLRSKIEHAEFKIGRPLTASFGVEFCEIAPDMLGIGVAHADRALYAAKEQGRNRAIFHYPSAPHGHVHRDPVEPPAD